MNTDKKFKWINDEIKIDFPVTKLLQNTFEEAEELDLQRNTEYFCVAEAIDCICKECCYNHLLTREQWDTVMLRYPEG